MAFDPFGNLMRAQIAKREMEQRESQQSIQNKMAMAQLAEMERRAQMQQSRQNALMNLYQPQQVSGTGPVRNVGGGGYQQLQFDQPNVGQKDIYGALMKIGDMEGAMQYAPSSPGYDIKQNASGEYVYLPKTPGQAVPSGIMGEAGDNKTTAIKEYEYGVKNPNFMLNKRKNEEEKRLKDLKEKRFTDSKALRTEFLKHSGEYQKVRDSYTRVLQSTKDPSPAGDLSLIFNYMKMLDPGSVVRESEFATAATAGSYGQRIQASVNKVLSGERLSESMRKDFLNKSSSLLSGMEKQHKKREKTYTSLAKRNNLPIEDVVIDITAPSEDNSFPPASPVPQAGVVEDGYRFKGGDPSDQNNWEKVR